MKDANGRPINTGNRVTISRHHKSGEARPEAAIVERTTKETAVVRIIDGPDAGLSARVTMRNIWLNTEEE